MTDKEIIIDVTNLEECKYFKGVGCINSPFKFWGCTKLGGMCSEHPNCYYKQLKRKEQECEELKQWKKDAENLFKTQTDNADKIINRYKQALDEIEELAKHNNFLVRDPFCGTGYRDLSGQILNIINKAKEK